MVYLIKKISSRECSPKRKGGIGLRRKIFDCDYLQPTAICCVNKEKIVKNESYRRT